MCARLGNVIYWFTLLILAGCLCFAAYQRLLNTVTQEEYKHYLSWETISPDSWEVYAKRENDDRRTQAIVALVAGLITSIVGKAIQYILGGTWKLGDLEKRKSANMELTRAIKEKRQMDEFLANEALVRRWKASQFKCEFFANAYVNDKRSSVPEMSNKADEMVEGVLQDAGVARAEDEAVPVRPCGVGGIDPQEAPEDGVGERRQRHGGARMAGVGALHGVHRQTADGVDREPCDVCAAGPAGCCGGGSRFSRGGHLLRSYRRRQLESANRERAVLRRGRRNHALL